jgi:uncharacterized protein
MTAERPERPPLTLLESLPPPLEEAYGHVCRRLDGLDTVVVAYSGGVDSALVAALAQGRLGSKALAVTGVSPALAPHLLAEARAQASWLGLAHRELATAELDDPAYASNPSDRCYACKSQLHGLLAALAARMPGAVVVDGVNHDDLSDHRPGLRAAGERGVISPLAEAGIDKQGVRFLSRALGLPWWDKPAQPCLASRFPYGEPINAARLERVAAAEAWLLQAGFRELRVRSQGETARIELGSGELVAALELLARGSLRDSLVEKFRDLGFSAVALDLEGLISGKLNRDLVVSRPVEATTNGEEATGT